MRRAAAGVVFLAVLASTPVWMSRAPVHARGAEVTWSRDLDASVERAARTGKALALLFR